MDDPAAIVLLLYLFKEFDVVAVHCRRVGVADDEYWFGFAHVVCIVCVMCEEVEVEVEVLAAGDRTPPQGWVHPRKDLKSIHIALSLACIESSSAEPPSTCQSVIAIYDPLMMTFPVFTIFILYMACIVCVVFERGRG